LLKKRKKPDRDANYNLLSERKESAWKRPNPTPSITCGERRGEGEGKKRKEKAIVNYYPYKGEMG